MKPGAEQKKACSNTHCISLIMPKEKDVKVQKYINYNWEIINWFVLAVMMFLVVVVVYNNPNSGEAPKKPSKDKVLSCYFSIDKNSLDPFYVEPSQVDPHLCTHINVAFATLLNNQIHLTDQQYKYLEQIVSLKKINPKLKVLLSVAGKSFAAMVTNHATRKEFIRSAKHILRENSLDGIDLDWEFPVYNLMLNSNERMHFSQLLREIRLEFMREKRGYLLTTSLAAQEIIVDVAYDVDQVDLYVDYANIMTYDYHLYMESTPFTGLNSPLYQRRQEGFYTAHLNINYTLDLYLQKGLSRDKIVIGIPTYGHTFKLVNENNGNVGSPAQGFGDIGQGGFVSFPHICNFIKTYGGDVNITFEPDARVPYLHRHYEWVSYENEQSVLEKARFVKEHDLRGAMVFSLNADDVNGICNGKVKFPLTDIIKNTLEGKNNAVTTCTDVKHSKSD